MPAPTSDVHPGPDALRARLLRDTLRYAPATLVPAAASVVSVLVFTRLLGTHDYGVYSVVLAAVTIATIGAAEWIGQSVLRYLPDTGDATHARELVADALGLSVAAALLLVVVVVVAGASLRLVVPRHAALVPLLVPIAALLVVEVVFSVMGAIMQARLQSQALSVFRVAGALLRLALAVGFVVWIAAGVPWLLAGAAAGRALTVLGALPFVAKSGGSWVRPRFDSRSLRRFAGYGVPMIGWTMAGQILGLSDRFVIGAFHGTGPVGVYSASYNLVTMGFGLLGGPLLMAAHPLIVSAWKARDVDDIAAVIAAYSRPYIVAVVPVLALLILCSHDVVSLVLPDEFREGSRIIPVLALGSFVWGYAMYGHKGLELAERTRLMFVLVAVCAVVNVVLNLIFVPRYGYVAAAWTTMGSSALYPVLVHAATRTRIPWRIPWSALAGALVAGALAGGAGAWAGLMLRDAVPALHLSLVTLVTLGVYVALFTGWRWLRRG